MKSESGDDNKSKNKDHRSVNKDLEEGEIGVSDEEVKTEIDYENVKWINNMFGSQHMGTCRKLSSEGHTGDDESQIYASEIQKPQQYVDYDRIENEDEWSFSTKANKSKNGRQNFIWGMPTSLKKKENSPTTPEGISNINPLSGEKGSSDSRDRKVPKNMKLGSLCRIKIKKKRRHKRKRRKSSDSSDPEDRPVCKYFMEGNCAKGSGCPFFHPRRKARLCKFFLRGYCKAGEKCEFIHNEFPCKFFHTGAVCHAGVENCKFSHKPLTEYTKLLLKSCLDKDNDFSDNPCEGASYRQSESSQPVVKRRCILGSPPRHVKESQKTKEWQEEMMRLSQCSRGFKIKIPRVKVPSPSRTDVPSPSTPSRLNFYTDTLLQSSSASDEFSTQNEMISPSSPSMCYVPNQTSPVGMSMESDKYQANTSGTVNKLSPVIGTTPVSAINQENEKSESSKDGYSAHTSKTHCLPDVTSPFNSPSDDNTSCQRTKFSHPIEHNRENITSEDNVDSEMVENAPKEKEPKNVTDESPKFSYYNSDEDDDDFCSSEEDSDSTEIDEDDLTEALEVQDKEPCPESPDSLPSCSLQAQLTRQKSSHGKSSAGVDQETDAYWEDIQCNPPTLSPVAKNWHCSSVEASPPSLEDSRLPDPGRAANSPLDLRVKFHDSRKAADFPVYPQLKSRQQNEPDEEFFLPPPPLIVPRTENNRGGMILQKPISASVLKDVQDHGSMLYELGDATTSSHNFVSLSRPNGEPSLSRDLAISTDISHQTLSSTSVTQPGILSGLLHSSLNCNTVGYLTNGNNSYERTASTTGSYHTEGVKTPVQKCVGAYSYQNDAANSSHDLQVDSAPAPVLKITPNSAQLHPQVLPHKSHIPGALGDPRFIKLHFPHHFFKQGSMAERKSQPTRGKNASIALSSNMSHVCLNGTEETFTPRTRLKRKMFSL